MKVRKWHVYVGKCMSTLTTPTRQCSQQLSGVGVGLRIGGGQGGGRWAVNYETRPFSETRSRRKFATGARESRNSLLYGAHVL